MRDAYIMREKNNQPYNAKRVTYAPSFCLDKIIFVRDKIKLVLDKIHFFTRLKSSYLLGKRIENDFKLWKNYFPWLKSYFPSISQAKMYFLAQNKIFCPGQKSFVQDKNYFVQYKKYFVRADGQGISLIYEFAIRCHAGSKFP